MDRRQIAGIVAALAFVIIAIWLIVPSPVPEPESGATITESFSQALWRFRSLDVVLQIFIILAGVFGVLTLVKEKR